MKSILLILICLAQFSPAIYAQQLIIKGKIRCLNTAANSTKGAEGVVVVPAFVPARSTITANNPSGFFEIKTGYGIEKLRDKTISLHAISRCSSCRESVYRVFISEDQDRMHRQDDKSYVTIKDWMLKTHCDKAELKAVAADSIYQLVSEQKGQDLNKVTTAAVLTGTPAFLNMLTGLVTVAGATGFPTGRFDVYSMNAGKISYGTLLQGSVMLHTALPGMTLNPIRDMSDAVVSNASAMAFSRKRHHISTFSNYHNYARLSGFFPVSEKLSFGVAALGSRQDEFRKTRFSQNQNFRWEDSLKMHLYEYTVYVSAAWRLHHKIALGIAVKMNGQSFNIPNFALVENDGHWSFTDSSIQKQVIDADLSLTFQPASQIRLGMNLMNLTGTSLYGDAFLPSDSMPVMLRQRTLGLGALYQYKRWHIGADLFIPSDGKLNLLVGLNVVPFNNALLSAGLGMRNGSYSISFRLKHFRLAYINDKGHLVNEQHKPKIAVFNGRIYGGFVFDID